MNGYDEYLSQFYGEWDEYAELIQKEELLEKEQRYEWVDNSREQLQRIPVSDSNESIS